MCSDQNEMITIEFPNKFRAINDDQEVEVNEPIINGGRH